MKELATDFKTIFKKDRGLFGWMFVQFALGVCLFLLPIVNLDWSSKSKVWVRYSDIASGYSHGDWYYLTTFSIIALTLGVLHNLIAARLHTKRGKDTARLFLGVSIAITLIAIFFLFRIIEINSK